MDYNDNQSQSNSDALIFKRLATLLRRNLWVLILSMAITAGGAFMVSKYRTPIYQAKTQIMVTRASSAGPVSDVTQTLNTQQLGMTYVELLSETWVRSAIAEQIGGKISKDQIKVSAANNTLVINVVVEDPNPNRAALIADTLVQVLVNKNEAIQSARYTEAEQGLSLQIQEIQAQISGIESQLAQARSRALDEKIQSAQDNIDATLAEIAELSPRDEENLALLQSLLSAYQEIYVNLLTYGDSQLITEEIEKLEKDLSLYQQIYLNLVASRETVRLEKMQNMPNVIQVTPAVAGEDPVRPQVLRNTILGAIAGLILAVIFVLLTHFLDTTLKTRDDIERNLNLPVLGYLLRLDMDESPTDRPYVMRAPRSPASEAFRSLRSNLEFISVDQSIKTILVSSPEAGVGKTTVATNLAAVIAQSGKRVLLLDADLRRPRVHEEMGLSNRVGLSQVFRDKVSLHDAIQSWDDTNLSVITSGGTPPNPAELLGSEKMGLILSQLEAEFDIIVIDSTPTLVTDSQLIAARVDGVLLIIWPGHTQAEAARIAVEQYRRAGARLLGVTLNNIQHGQGYEGYAPYTDKYRYYQSDSEPGRTGLRGVLRWPWSRGPKEMPPTQSDESV